MGLSDQHFFRVVVLSASRLADWSWQGDEIHYARLSAERIWGACEETGPSVARQERAILDCLANPRWGVSLPQSAEAIDRALAGGLPVARLVKAARRYESAAVVRRLGFLIELLAGADVSEPLLRLRGRSNGYVLLAASGPTKGPTNARWRVRVNVGEEALLAHRQTG